MNKIILAYYVNIGNVRPEEAMLVIEQLETKFKDESMVQYFIPIREGESRVECVYPKYVVGEQVDSEMKETIDRLNVCVKKLNNE